MGKKSRRRAKRQARSASTSDQGAHPDVAFTASEKQTGASASRAIARATVKSESALQYQVIGKQALEKLEHLEVVNNLLSEMKDRATRVSGKLNGAQKFQLVANAIHVSGWGFHRLESKPINQRSASVTDAVDAEVELFSTTSRSITSSIIADWRESISDENPAGYKTPATGLLGPAELWDPVEELVKPDKDLHRELIAAKRAKDDAQWCFEMRFPDTREPSVAVSASCNATRATLTRHRQ